MAANFAKLPGLRRWDGWSFVLNDRIDGDPMLRGGCFKATSRIRMGRSDHVAAGSDHR
jgi:hypothetical protein